MIENDIIVFKFDTILIQLPAGFQIYISSYHICRRLALLPCYRLAAVDAIDVCMYHHTPIGVISQGQLANMNSAEEELAKTDKSYDILLYMVVVLQYLLLFKFLYAMSHDNLPWYD